MGRMDTTMPAPARNFSFYVFICSLSHTQILIEFIVTTIVFVALMFRSAFPLHQPYQKYGVL